jgi:hypothetical protein
MGFMAITDEVNVELLNECFELRPFHGLYKSHPDDVLQPPESDDSIDLKTSMPVYNNFGCKFANFEISITLISIFFRY